MKYVVHIIKKGKNGKFDDKGYVKEKNSYHLILVQMAKIAIGYFM